MSADPYAEVGTSADPVKEERTAEEANHEFLERRHYQRRGPYNNKPQIGQEIVILTDKIVLPIRQFPTYNFVGKLLGPKGNNLKAMQSFAKVKMSIKGRGSHKDQAKEEELLAGADPQYEHLAEPLHVIISAKASRIEAHRRLALACRELNKFMGPVNEDMSHGNPPVMDMGEPMHHNNREMILPPHTPGQPQIMFGVPPPGAIILNENPTFTQSRAPPPPRGDDRKSPRESFSYGKPSDSRMGEKRGASSSGGFPLKRYKQEPYSRSPYTSR